MESTLIQGISLTVTETDIFQDMVTLRRHIPEIEDAIKANLSMQQQLWTWMQRQTDMEVQNLMNIYLVSNTL